MDEIGGGEIMAVMRRVVAVLLAVVLIFGAFTKVSALEDGGLRDNERIAIERMTQGFENFEERIDLSDLNIPLSSLSVLFSHATKNSPYLFYVDKRLTYTYRGNAVFSVMPKYNLTKDEANAAVEYSRGVIEKIVGLANMGNSELERLLLAHDIICYHYSYDLTLECNDIYKSIKEGKGTCQGYTWTYMAVLRELGIECEYVASDTISHIWLRVKIDGLWYHSDVTWDDPVGDEATVSRRHVLFSDDKADMDGYRDRYGACDNQCTSAIYDENDMSDILSPNHVASDINHDGAVDLGDLVIILQGGAGCPICRDVDGDLILTENDTFATRELILTNPCE